MILAGAEPTTAQIWVPAVVSAVITIIGSYLVYKNSRRANAITADASLSAQQLAWTQQAMNEATAAKTEARAATVSAGEAERSAKGAREAAGEATRRATLAESRLTEVTDVTNRLIDWIARVVRKAHAEGISDSASPEVSELLRIINGGPPEISSSRLRRHREDGHG